MDSRVAALASRQHGVVTRAQLLDAGLTPSAVDGRVAKGFLHPAHRGVYRVGHRAPSTEARYMAAVLACGEGAVLSGLAAAFVFGLIKGSPPRPEVSTTRNRRIGGVITHRRRHLTRQDTTVYGAIPITTIPCTVIDLAATLPLDALARACHEAQVRYQLTAAMVEAALVRRSNAPGRGKLHEIFHGDAHVVLSELERRFIALMKSAGLPLPSTNKPAGTRYVDCRWPDARLTVELDSYRYHHTRHAWEQDRRREREARARGDDFRRYTWGDVTDDADVVAAELKPLLPSPKAPSPATRQRRQPRPPAEPE